MQKMNQRKPPHRPASLATCGRKPALAVASFIPECDGIFLKEFDMPKVLPQGKSTAILRFGTLDEVLFIDEKMSQMHTRTEKREWLQSYRKAWEKRDNWGGISRAKVFATIDRWLAEV